MARDQPRSILETSERRDVSVRIVPFDVDGFVGIGHPLMILGGPVPALDTVFLDTVHGGAFLDAASQLGRSKRTFEKVERVALTAADAQNFVLRLIRQI